MPTNISSFTGLEIQLKYREPELTGPLNAKLAGILASGVHRGFRFTTEAGNRTISVTPDAEYDDHLAVVETSNGYALTIHREPGSFVVDLTAFAGTTVVLAIFGTYPGPPTTAVLRAYTVVEYDALTAADLQELVILGTVNVPAGAVPIPAADITHDRRTGAWSRSPPESVSWAPLVKNSSFEWGNPNGTDARAALAWESAISVGTAQWILKGTGIGHTGDKAMVLRSTAAGVNPITGTLRQNLYAPVVPNQWVKLQLFFNLVNVAASGTSFVDLVFLDTSGAVVSTLSTSLPFATVSVGYQRVDKCIRVPATAFFLAYVQIRVVALDYVLLVDGVRLDDIQVWVENVTAEKPYAFEDKSFAPLLASEVVLGPAALTNFADPLGLLRYLVSGGLAELVLERKDQQVSPAAALPTFRNKGQQILGEGRLGGTPAVTPANQQPYAQSIASTAYTLQSEFLPGGALAGASGFRVYSGGTGEMVFTINAKRTGVQWTADTTLNPSFKMVFATTSNLTDSSEAFRIWKRSAGAGNWDDTTGLGGDWTRASLALTLGGVLEGLMTLHDGRLKFTNPSLSNPAVATGLTNTLLAKNTIKAWGRVDLSTAGVATLVDGVNVTSAVADIGTAKITITLADDLADTNYGVVFGVHSTTGGAVIVPRSDLHNVGDFIVQFIKFTFAGAGSAFTFNDGVNGVKFTFFVVGIQN